MFAYLAFKALNPDALISARQKTPLELDPVLGLSCLEAEEGTFEEGHGVYAATIDEAQWYARYNQGKVYFVAPLPGKQAVVGETGWRAEVAVCLPKKTHRKSPPRALGALSGPSTAENARPLNRPALKYSGLCRIETYLPHPARTRGCQGTIYRRQRLAG